MATQTPPRPALTRAELAEGGYVVGARCGSENEPRRLGTILDVPGAYAIAVLWDDDRGNGHYEQRTWLSIAPLGPGYVLSARAVKRLMVGRRSA